MQITVVHPSELGQAELALWASFQRRNLALANPFLSPAFTVAVGRFRPRARVAVLTEGATITGFFPFERRSLGYGVPVAAGLTGCQGLIHAPGSDWDPQQLLSACGLDVWTFDHLVDGQKPFQPYQVIHVPSPIMDFEKGFDAYLVTLRNRSRQLLSNLAYKQRKLAREVGEVRFVYDSRDPAALRAVMAWKSAQYRRTGRSNRFAWPGVTELVEHLLDTRSNGFRGVLSMLYAHEEPVAGFFLLCTEDVAVDWFPAYNPTFGKYSPGFLLRLRVAEAAAALGVHHLDMGRGTRDHYKQRFKSRDLVVAEGRVLRRSPAAALHWARTAPARRIRHVITEHAPLLRTADRVLYTYGRLR
ncbi:MAG: GNAT family N-acetyltransferase, partial [Actinobacteria bacterium]|nr:GNAT family N-acetyltransferase [Actinomycetota bacterium]